MILGFGVSFQGTNANKKENQDAFIISKHKNGSFLVAVADGVGSAKYSKIASSLAVQCVAKHVLEQKFDFDSKKAIIKILSDSFKYALEKINQEIAKNNHSEDEYDTTLTAAIYDGQNIAYGHSGDGGIIGLTNQGKYVAVTKPQKGEDGFSVIPLRASASWDFSAPSEKFASILLATDGIYDTFFPYLLRGQETELYVPLIKEFMDNGELKITKKTLKKAEETLSELVLGKTFKAVTDDKTVAVALNESIIPKKQNESYYAMPDWEKLKDEWNKKAYPHLYKTEGE